MRRIRLFIASSLDGYIARDDGGIDWLLSDADYGFAAFYESIDTVIMGRKTYEQSLGFESFPFAGKICHVFSRMRAGQRDRYATFVGDDIAGYARALRAGEGRDIWLVGGGEVVRALLDASLVDEIVLSIHPVLLGGGRPLFPRSREGRALSLQECTRYSSGLVQLRYTTAAAP